MTASEEGRYVRVPDNEETASMCICGNCPTYNKCTEGKEEWLFCARGSTECGLMKTGCICGECPVAHRHALTMNYYCDIGRAVF